MFEKIRIGKRGVWDQDGKYHLCIYVPNSPNPDFENNQPERSKREDDKQFNNFICGNCHAYKEYAKVCRCGALNSMET